MKPKKRKIKVSPWDPADYLKTPEDCAAYLEACAEEAPGDAGFLARALGDVAKSKGMRQVAKDAGVSRESLYRSLSAEGNPELETVLRVLESLGLRLKFTATARRRAA